MHHLQEVEGMSLKACEYLVFDEADRLFEMGFADQLKEVRASPSWLMALDGPVGRRVGRLSEAGFQTSRRRRAPHAVPVDALAAGRPAGSPRRACLPTG